MFLNRCETNFAENHYYRTNQILLSMLDLWPNRRSKFAKINYVFHFVIMLSFIIVQLTSFLTLQVTLNSFIIILSYAVPSLFVIVQYCAFYANPNEVKQMWKNIRDSWSLLKNETERDIMRKYASTGELHTILLTLSVFVSVILYAFLELMPIILDIIFPLNETRPRKIHALTEYFIDERTYFYAILCHWFICISFGFFVLMATGTLEFVYFQHICGLLKIARCSEFVRISFMPLFFLMAIIFVSSISLNLFRLFQAISLLQSIEELITSIAFVCILFVFLFVANYLGQNVTDHNSEIFDKTYNVRWYMVPVKIQKLLLFIMQNTTKLYILNVGNLIAASMEDFTKLTSLSVSYFTVMYSLLKL
ncbi:uncharacterized protein [Anoplolepis gracilipes]|uniref:uncharacterized protein isoform X2 n=1 Tax=Anoplolepis gracilipes TaxID=354296 RepID=UPI003BA068CC